MFPGVALRLARAGGYRAPRAAHRAATPAVESPGRAPARCVAVRRRIIRGGNAARVPPGGCARRARRCARIVPRAANRADRMQCFARRCDAETARNAETTCRCGVRALELPLVAPNRRGCGR